MIVQMRRREAMMGGRPLHMRDPLDGSPRSTSRWERFKAWWRG